MQISTLDAIKKLTEQIDEIEEDFRHFFNLSYDLFCVFKPDGYFVNVNQRFTDVLGYTREELLENPYIDIWWPADKEKTYHVIQSLQDKATFKFCHRLITKEGKSIAVEWTSTAFNDKGKAYAVGRIMDNKYDQSR